MAGVSFEIKSEIAVVREGKWNLELNLVSWNGQKEKYDIRKWSPEHDKCGKGITLEKEDLVKLYEVLAKEVSELVSEERI